MTIGKRIGISVIAFTLAGAWALPASGAEQAELTPQAIAALAAQPAKTAAPTSKVARSATPTPKVAKVRTVKRFWRHRPIRLVAAEWPAHTGYRASIIYLILGVAY